MNKTPNQDWMPPSTPPPPTFKFENDTPGHLLIQTLADPAAATLIFEIYGTNDGRIATTTEPVVSSVSPPPEDLYIDDPTLPAGTIKQIDYAAWGAKSAFDYTVVRGGETIYQKPSIQTSVRGQAKFLRGTGPAI